MAKRPEPIDRTVGRAPLPSTEDTDFHDLDANHCPHDLPCDVCRGHGAILGMRCGICGGYGRRTAG